MKLESISINGLHDKYDYDIHFRDNSLIMIG